MGDQPTPPTDGPQAAEQPSGIPARGWKAVGKRTLAAIKHDHLSLLAAGVAFKSLLALFPAIVAAVTIWSLVAEPQEMAQQTQSLTRALPGGAAQLIQDQVGNVAGSSQSTLSVALVVSVALALWAASGGMAGLMEGTNAAYDEVDTRKFPVKRGIAILLTLGGIVFLLVTISLIAVLPPLLDVLRLPQGVRVVVQVVQWVVLAAVMVVSLGILYRVGPDRARPTFRWVSAGAVVATMLWLLGSALFALYVDNFGKFGETYGAFAGIIVLMLWLFLTGFVVLLGAEINAETERQTRADTTVGEAAPIGYRGAEAADTTAMHANDRRA